MVTKSIWKSMHENDGLSKYGGRDLMGYGQKPPSPKWPGNAKVAINFVINYEEGAESCVLHGDDASEHLLSDIVDATPYQNERNLNMESMYDYGSRSGFWRLRNTMLQKKIPCTVFAVGMALERNPAVCQALKETDEWEVASHGYRWIDYRNVPEDIERDHIWRTVQIHERLLGKRPVGFYLGKPNKNTRRLIVEEGGFKYDSDSYADDLPYWTIDYDSRPHLIIPYSLCENDMRFVSSNNLPTGSDFCQHLKDTLKALVAEAKLGQPKMMTIGLHCRLARPARVAALAEFIDFAKGYNVWFATREQIADFWTDNHYPHGAGKPVTPIGKASIDDDDADDSNGSEKKDHSDSKDGEEDEINEEDGDCI